MHKPVEYRKLYHPDLEGVQGNISLWIEIFDKTERPMVKKWDISPPPQTDLELRLIVWETEDIPMMDVEGTSDIYIAAFNDVNDKQSTDIHFRCQTGKGSFNWRMLIPCKYPADNTILNIQAYDNDIFSHDDYISGCSLNMQRLLREVYQLDVPIKVNLNYNSLKVK